MLNNIGIKIITALLLLSPIEIESKKITIAGCGYVGLTVAAVLADGGHQVTCVDVDKNKISRLNNYELPFFEPNLDDALFGAARAGAILFSDSIDECLDADIFYICVGTPTNTQGVCDCTYLHAAFNMIAKRSKCTEPENEFMFFFSKITQTTVDATCRLKNRKIICVKSTLPPCTMSSLQQYLDAQNNNHYGLVYNPEFMREGSALHDIYTNNPIVLGGAHDDDLETVCNLYCHLENPTINIIKTNFETAEMIKYAWNSFSAIRIAYVNELALMCRKINADIATLIEGFAHSEELLPTHVIRPGPGYGGSCLPKDTTSFSNVLKHNGFVKTLVHQAIKSNKHQTKAVIQDILSLLEPSTAPHIISILGLSFKARTDDIRYSPAIAIIQALIERGIIVHAYDPKAMSNMQQLFPEINYFDSPYEASENADCIVALTEWDEIKNIDLEKLSQCCKKKRLIDTRNIYDVKKLNYYGFDFINMGRL